MRSPLQTSALAALGAAFASARRDVAVPRVAPQRERSALSRGARRRLEGSGLRRPPRALERRQERRLGVALAGLHGSAGAAVLPVSPPIGVVRPGHEGGADRRDPRSVHEGVVGRHVDARRVLDPVQVGRHRLRVGDVAARPVDHPDEAQRVVGQPDEERPAGVAGAEARVVRVAEEVALQLELGCAPQVLRLPHELLAGEALRAVLAVLPDVLLVDAAARAHRGRERAVTRLVDLVREPVALAARRHHGRDDRRHGDLFREHAVGEVDAAPGVLPPDVRVVLAVRMRHAVIDRHGELPARLALAEVRRRVLAHVADAVRGGEHEAVAHVDARAEREPDRSRVLTARAVDADLGRHRPGGIRESRQRREERGSERREGTSHGFILRERAERVLWRLGDCGQRPRL